MNVDAKRKDWDSEFFGYEVYEARLTEPGEKSFKNELLMLGNKARLLYLNSTKEIKDLPGNDCILSDIKVLYSKADVEANAEPNKAVSSFSTDSGYEQLIDLAFASGEYSRFKLDVNFRNNEFEKLYTEWIKRSVTREIADEVFVYKENGQPVGFVTITIKNKTACIGLIAVKEGFRGMNIGKKLLAVTDNYALEKGCNRIEVFTQGQNKSACSFYEKNGFVVSKLDYIYHCWFTNNA